MRSYFSTCTLRWWEGQGAIRLEEEEEPMLKEKGVLPLWADQSNKTPIGFENESKGGYTQSRLLFECVVASIWNGCCLCYLLLFPHVDQVTNEVLSPRPGFIYLLLGLVMLPLVIGMCAGAEAMLGQREEEKLQRKTRSKLAKFGISVGFIGCCVGIGAIVAFVVRDQALWLQIDLGFATLCAQALLIRNTIQADWNEATEDRLDIYEFLRETSEPKLLSQRKVSTSFTIECSSPLP
ncbi:hypothetical protein JCM3765_003865 [Sporobolomyces pararoseus]